MRLQPWQEYLQTHQTLADALLGVSDKTLLQRSIHTDIIMYNHNLHNPRTWVDGHWKTPRQKRIRTWFKSLT